MTTTTTSITPITTKEISIDRLLKAVKDDNSGAIVLFLGTVRKKGQSGIVTKMYYESYAAMAKRQIEELEEEIKQRWPINNIKIVHRVGELQVGDTSVAICISSTHREEAFESCRYAIDRIKHVVPIWKKEILIDNSQTWIKGHDIETI
jgi:molybdopterin synthase catalytic subunit